MGLKTFFEDWVKHRRAVKLAKIKGGYDYPFFKYLLGCLVFGFLGVMLICCVFYGLLANTIGGVVENIAPDIIEGVSENPELVYLSLLKDELDEEPMLFLAGIHLLKQLDLESGISGSVSGEFQNSKEYELVKLNPMCVEQYDYGMSEHPVSKSNTAGDVLNRMAYEKLMDRGCIIYHKYASLVLYKCPLYVCEYEIIEKKIMGDFVPGKIEINTMEVKAGGK